MVRAGDDRLRHRRRAGKGRPEIPEGRQGVAGGVHAGAKGTAERGQGLRALRFAWRSLVMCIFAAPFRNACFLCHALEIFMNLRLAKLKGSRPGQITAGQGARMASRLSQARLHAKLQYLPAGDRRANSNPATLDGELTKFLIISIAGRSHSLTAPGRYRCYRRQETPLFRPSSPSRQSLRRLI